MSRSLTCAWTLFVALTSFSALALDVKSAHREPGESYLPYKRQAQLAARALRAPLPVAPTEASASDVAKSYGTVTLPPATAWASLDVLNQNFAKVRDLRWLDDPDHPGFLRRSSWLYPDDGCFARAGLAILDFVKDGITAPNKIFVFGDLTVKTVNASGGSVNWWYHVAPIVEVAGLKYVLDPAIEPHGPLALDAWIYRMANNLGDVQVAICNSGTYTPSDSCGLKTDGVENQAMIDQPFYLTQEWLRLEQLKRVPADELGDKPPW